MGTAAGRYSPELTLTAVAEALLMRRDAELVTMRWRYDSEPRGYFDLTADGGAELRGAIGEMLDQLAIAIARDLLLHPKPQKIEIVSKQRMPVDPPRGVARRMAPNESLPYHFATTGRAAITTPRQGWALDSCVIAAIDGRPPERLFDIRQPADRIRIAPANPGRHRFTLSCPTSGPERWIPRELEVEVEANRLYCTDGEIFVPTDVAFRCQAAAASEIPAAAE